MAKERLCLLLRQQQHAPPRCPAEFFCIGRRVCADQHIQLRIRRAGQAHPQSEEEAARVRPAEQAAQRPVPRHMQAGKALLPQLLHGHPQRRILQGQLLPRPPRAQAAQGLAVMGLLRHRQQGGGLLRVPRRLHQREALVEFVRGNQPLPQHEAEQLRRFDVPAHAADALRVQAQAAPQVRADALLQRRPPPHKALPNMQRRQPAQAARPGDLHALGQQQVRPQRQRARMVHPRHRARALQGQRIQLAERRGPADLPQLRARVESQPLHLRDALRQRQHRQTAVGEGAGPDRPEGGRPDDLFQRGVFAEGELPDFRKPRRQLHPPQRPAAAEGHLAQLGHAVRDLRLHQPRAVESRPADDAQPLRQLHPVQGVCVVEGPLVDLLQPGRQADLPQMAAAAEGPAADDPHALRQNRLLHPGAHEAPLRDLLQALRQYQLPHRRQLLLRQGRSHHAVKIVVLEREPGEAPRSVHVLQPYPPQGVAAEQHLLLQAVHAGGDAQLLQPRAADEGPVADALQPLREDDAAHLCPGIDGVRRDGPHLRRHGEIADQPRHLQHRNRRALLRPRPAGDDIAALRGQRAIRQDIHLLIQQIADPHRPAPFRCFSSHFRISMIAQARRPVNPPGARKKGGRFPALPREALGCLAVSLRR